MEVNFADGIKIVIDDDKLLMWKQHNDNTIEVAMNQGNKIHSYKIDIQNKKVYTNENI